MKKGEEPGKNESEQQTVCVSLASFKHTLSVYCGTNFLSICKFIFVKLSVLNKIMLFYLCMSVCLLHSLSHIQNALHQNMLYALGMNWNFDITCIKTYKTFKQTTMENIENSMSQ